MEFRRWNFPLARVVFAWPDVASPSVPLGLPVRWAGVTAPGLFLGSLCDHAETDARKFNSAPSRRRRMLSAGALSAGSTNPRSQGRRRGSASRFGCTRESRSSVPPRPPARRDVYEWPKSDILRSQGGLVVAYLRLIAHTEAAVCIFTYIETKSVLGTSILWAKATTRGPSTW
jgi:hypothetical protein